MMGPRQVEQGALLYNFSIDAHVPADHLLRSIDGFVDLSELRGDLAPFYSSMGRRDWRPYAVVQPDRVAEGRPVMPRGRFRTLDPSLVDCALYVARGRQFSVCAVPCPTDDMFEP